MGGGWGFVRQDVSSAGDKPKDFSTLDQGSRGMKALSELETHCEGEEMDSFPLKKKTLQ